MSFFYPLSFILSRLGTLTGFLCDGSSVKPRTPQTVHDTHIQFASQQKHLTPAELTRLKFERDQHAANQQMAQVQIQRRAEAARQIVRSSQILHHCYPLSIFRCPFSYSERAKCTDAAVAEYRPAAEDAYASCSSISPWRRPESSPTASSAYTRTAADRLTSIPATCPATPGKIFIS